MNYGWPKVRAEQGGGPAALRDGDGHLSAAVHSRVFRPSAAIVIASQVCMLVVGTAVSAADTAWTSGTTPGNWGIAGNWTAGVPNSASNAFTTNSGASITLGSGAQAKTLFVEGPVGGESVLTAGSLGLADQLWINVATGTSGATALRLEDAGAAPVSVTAANATLAADPGNQGAVILDSSAGGNVSLAVVNTLTIGYEGDGSYVFRIP